MSRSLEELKQEFLDDLEHSGVKGMKWGIRKSAKLTEAQDRIMAATPGANHTTVVSKNGDVLSVEKERPGPLSIAVGKLTGRKPENNVSSMVLRNKDGKKVGSFQVWKDNPTTIRGEWLEVSKTEQGKGYSEAAIRGLMKAASADKTLKEVRLQVPSDAAPAKHIYTKLGFVKDKVIGNSSVYGDLEDWVYRV